jgi:hypothetical protein
MLTWAMHLTLLVPGLLWPREVLRDTTFDLPLPALEKLLGRGRRSPLASEEAWLAQTFGVDAPMAAAALRLLGERGDAGAFDWLCLDPVHLRLEERTIVLDDPARLEVDADEDAALRQSMAPLFAHLGEIVATTPGRWHLRLAQPADIETAELPGSIGRPVDPTLPGGTEGAAWRQLLAEAQPVLHDHAVNRRREEAGRPTVSALWPWGRGRLPLAMQTRYRTLWSDDPVLKGLSTLSGMLSKPMPRGFAVVRGRVLARFDGLAGSLSSLDTMSWRESLVGLEENWLASSLSAIGDGVLRRLTLVMSGHDRAVQITVERRDLWRFWRKPIKLADLEA